MKKTTMENPMRLTFIPVPRIDRHEIINFHNGKIVLNGSLERAEIWSTSDSNAHTLLENLVFAISELVDPKFSVKLISSQGAADTNKHPSDPDWAYSKIDLSEIPILELSDGIWHKIIYRLKAYEDGSWENELDQSDRFLFKT